MSVGDMGLEELVKCLTDIGNLVTAAEQEQNHYREDLRARSRRQLPTLIGCEELLSAELHRRLGGYNELAEVAIDALEEEVQRRRELLADTFGPLESREDVEEREAEEREALGTTVREIEAAEAQADEAFKVLHPEVLYDTGMLHAVRHHIDHAIAENERLRREAEEQHAEADRKDMEALAEHEHVRLGLPKCLQSEDHNPILWAMKEAAWASLQRLGTDVLVEYLKLWVKKHKDYGPENHAIWGCQGAVIRATDKLMRLKGHYFDGRMMLTDKTEDDWLDLIGYGLIGLIVERGLWPVTTIEDVIETMRATDNDAYERMVEFLVEEEYEREYD